MVRLKLYSQALWAIALVTDRSRLSRSCPGPPGNPHQSKVAYMPWSSEATLPSNIVTTLVSRGAICDVLMKVAPQEDTPITLFQVASKGSTWGPHSSVSLSSYQGPHLGLHHWGTVWCRGQPPFSLAPSCRTVLFKEWRRARHFCCPDLPTSLLHRFFDSFIMLTYA